MGGDTQETDRVTFGVSLGTILLISCLLVLKPAGATQAISFVFAFLTEKTGLLFIWAGFGAFAFLLVLGLSPYGSLSLGPKDEEPDYSTLSWAGMLFSTGIGTAILFWGTIEWIEYYTAPPFGIAPESPEALDWAGSYGLFHWGLIGWAFYALPAVCLSYSYHIRKEDSLSLAAACRPVLRNHTEGWGGRCINLLFVVGLLGSASTGIGLTTPLITESVSAFFGIEPSFAYTVGAVLLVIGLITFSVSRRLEHGIRRLSDINLFLMLALLGVVLFGGPTTYLLEHGLRSVGFMLRHFTEMGGLRYPAENASFTKSWTVFYWAWWLALGPFVGMFICKISRGRTLRQLIFGVLGFGTLGCILCFTVFGGYSIYLAQVDGLPLVENYTENRHGTVIQVVTSLGIGKWILPLFFVLCVSFAATTYDSASYTLAAATTRRLPVNEDPPRWSRVVWAGALGLLPVALLWIGYRGEADETTSILVPLQTASVVVSLPILGVGILMVVSLLIALREGHRRDP